MRIDNEEEYSLAAKVKQNNFYVEDFIRSVETAEEAIEVLNQLKSLPSGLEFELMKWISNQEAVNEAIPEDLKSKSNTKQIGS